MRVEDKLLQKKEAVDHELERLLSRENSLLFKAMRHSVFSGGKRFRPLLALSSGECLGASQVTILPFACALELIHNYSLIHDDLPSMDNDDFRRGMPSCHKAFGEDIAILAGDSLLTLAFEVLAQAPLEERLIPKKEQIILEISRLAGAEGLIGGQFMDITFAPEGIKEEEIHKLILRKTGALIIASLKVGGIIGEASPPQLEGLVKYGRNIGFAFQIRDDILDFEKELQRTHEPRPNYVSHFGLEEAERRLKNFVDEAQYALKETSLESHELRYLALRLLDLRSGNENGQNS